MRTESIPKSSCDLSDHALHCLQSASLLLFGIFVLLTAVGPSWRVCRGRGRVAGATTAADSRARWGIRRACRGVSRATWRVAWACWRVAWRCRRVSRTRRRVTGAGRRVTGTCRRIARTTWRIARTGGRVTRARRREPRGYATARRVARARWPIHRARRVRSGVGRRVGRRRRVDVAGAGHRWRRWPIRAILRRNASSVEGRRRLPRGRRLVVGRRAEHHRGHHRWRLRLVVVVRVSRRRCISHRRLGDR
jgi:hypothetical protein